MAILAATLSTSYISQYNLSSLSFSSICANSRYFLSFSSENVNVTKLHFGFDLNSSINLTRQSLDLRFLHSMHSPQPIATHLARLSTAIGTHPPFFLFGRYFGFLINLGYKHIICTVRHPHRVNRTDFSRVKASAWRFRQVEARPLCQGLLFVSQCLPS